MRPAIVVSLIALLAAPALTGFRAPPIPVSSVSVTIGPKLQAKAREYGQRDLDQLAQELKHDIERAAAGSGRGGPGGVRLELEIVDAKPSRPTYAQMSANPSLSMRSVSTGGATVRGVEHGPRGDRPVTYSYYESDIRNERAAATWTDADRAFDMFAREYAAGKR
jgi:hypothetical protein